MALSAPAVGHPEARHDVARLRLLARAGDEWDDLGNVFGDDASPGSREWSGSAVRRADGSVSIYYTAAGHRGEARPTYVQRVIEARPKLVTDGGRIRLEGPVAHHELLRSDGRTYLPAGELDGAPGRIRAFRDPGWFREPADGRQYLLVAASVAWQDGFMGAVALAAERRGVWSLLPPLMMADGINHELERPHVVVHDSHYYLFLVTQRHSFHPPGSAPTGLYGFVAPSLTGPYEPLNGSGLVIRNPSNEPDQAYAWWVLPDLRAIGFVNYRSAEGPDVRHAAATEARACFGGTHRAGRPARPRRSDHFDRGRAGGATIALGPSGLTSGQTARRLGPSQELIRFSTSIRRKRPCTASAARPDHSDQRRRARRCGDELATNPGRLARGAGHRGMRRGVRATAVRGAPARCRDPEHHADHRGLHLRPEGLGRGDRVRASPSTADGSTGRRSAWPTRSTTSASTPSRTCRSSRTERSPAPTRTARRRTAATTVRCPAGTSS